MASFVSFLRITNALQMNLGISLCRISEQLIKGRAKLSSNSKSYRDNNNVD